MTQTRKWALGTALVVVLVLVASWFLLISPKRSEAADLRSQTASQLSANEMLRSQISILKAQSKHLPAQQARLARMQEKLPQAPELPSLIRDLTMAARQSGATLVELSPGEPVSMDGVTAGAAPPGAESPATSPAVPAATAAPGTPTESLLAIPLSLEVHGSFTDLKTFLSKVEELSRTMQVTGFTVAPNEASAGATTTTGGSEASDGSIKVTISGRVFMTPKLDPTALTGAVPAPAATSSPTTAPSGS